jgi:hypothetical protein
MGGACCNYLLIIQIKYFIFEYKNLYVCLGIAWYRFHIENFTFFFAPPTLKENGKKGKEESVIM